VAEKNKKVTIWMENSPVVNKLPGSKENSGKLERKNSVGMSMSKMMPGIFGKPSSGDISPDKVVTRMHRSISTVTYKERDTAYK
jgi:hypothetical protein